jgi:hypothetical protein
MVHIKKEGVFFEFVEVDEEGNESKKMLDVLKSSLGIVSYLTFPVTIDEGITVEDLMSILAINPETTDFVFDSSLGGHPFMKFLDEMNEDAPADDILSRMEIAHESDPISDDDMEFFSVVRMRGVGKNKDLLSVEFSTVSSYKKMEVRLNTSYVIRKVDTFEKEHVLVSCTKAFTLYEVLHAMLYEMSYYGDAEERKEVLAGVIKSLGVEKIEAFKLSDKSSVDSLKKELQDAIDSEDYEEAARIRDKINKLFTATEQSEDDSI